jgi:tetratricopeptide (TPR) repeat protein
MQEKIRESGSKARLLTALIIIVCTAVFVVHRTSLSAEARSIDDDQYFVENILVQNPGWKSAWRFLTEVLEPSTVSGYYQPLTMISLMVDYALGGRADNLMPFHCTSLALHMANTVLIIVLLYLLFGNAWAAAGAGLLFGIHPMTVETIAWVSERKTLLAAFFAFWCLTLYVCYARKKNRRFYLGCMAMYILALMSKPTSTPLPIMMLLMDYWPLKRLNRQAVLEKIPFLALGHISAVITYISQSRTATVGLPAEYGPERIPLVICHNIVFYLYKIIWPVNLSSYYAYPAVFSLSNPMLMAGIIGSCVLILLLIISLRWTRAALTGWLIFFVALLPTMQIIGFSIVIASDKFAYLPSVGLLMVLAAFAAWFYSANKTLIWRIVIVIVVLISAGAEAVGTRGYLVHWRSMMSLSKHFLALAPDAAQINLMMGYAFQREGKLDEAEHYCRRAVQLAPSYIDANNNLALVLKLQGKFDEAADYYRKASQAAPKDANIHYNLGNALQSLGKLDEAISQYYEALKINPEHAHAHNNLANALSEQGKLDEAVDHYRQTLKIKPSNAEAYNNLGTALEMQGKLDEAIDCYSRALRIKPDFVEAYRNLASLFEAQGELEEAVIHYRKAMQFKPNDIELHLKVGTLLASQNKFDEAIGHFSQVLRLAPDNAEAHYNIGMALAMTDKPRKAIEHLKQAMQLKPSWSEPAIWMARILATYPDPTVRDPNNAVIIATHAAELTKYQDPEVLETLAAGYAATGQFELAVKTAQEALALASAAQNNELVSRLRDTIERYKQATH